MKTSHRKNAGFTLLEIMLVVLIIGVLLAYGVSKMGGSVDEAKKVAAAAGINRLTTSLTMYEMATKSPPTTEQGLKALVTKPEGVRNWSQKTEASDLEDPWGKEFIYVYPGVHNPKSFDIFSCGPDKLPNTPDDIGNWSSEGK